MKFILPYITTNLEKKLFITFLLTPIWWVLGLNIYIYQFIVFLSFPNLLLAASQKGYVLKIPLSIKWFFLFLVLYLSSILLNYSEQDTQRVFASFNNFSLFLMGLGLMVIFFNCHTKGGIINLLKISKNLTIISGSIAIFFITIYFYGQKRFEFCSFTGKMFPSLLEYPFFYNLLLIKGAVPDWPLKNILRIGIYSLVNTATGGFMLAILPMTIAYYKLKSTNTIIKKGICIIVLFIGMVPLIASFSRMAIFSLILASFFVFLIGKNRKLIYILIVIVVLFFAFQYLYDALIWLLHFRETSTNIRTEIYKESIKFVFEINPILGIGVKPREHFTMRALGSHSTYVGLLVVSGIFGLVAFIAFQFSIFICWYRLKKRILTNNQMIIWKYLGISFISMTLWLLTDSLDALPFITYAYFIIIGGIFSLCNELNLSVEDANHYATI